MFEKVRIEGKYTKIPKDWNVVKIKEIGRVGGGEHLEHILKKITLVTMNYNFKQKTKFQ